MVTLEFERAVIRRVSIDFCFACQLIWFDGHEATELSPGAVIEVFKALDANRSEARNPLTTLLDCPRCTSRLQLTRDLQRTTRFSYFRCPYGHGRLSPFMQFLREKNFIRPLSGAELADLRAKIRSIQCSNCGAPVDLERESACTYCHTPISILDPEAVAKTVKELSTAEARRQSIDVNVLADALLQKPQSADPLSSFSLSSGKGGLAVDLVAVGLGIVAALLR
jgi:DNA-directed RNA polymerase subunit RPC12/RpoP